MLAPLVHRIQLKILWTYGTFVIVYCPGPVKPELGGSHTSKT